MKINVVFIFLLILTSCASTVGTTDENISNSSIVVISEMSSSQTTLDRTDIAKFFCNNLTEYFNAYKYYKISTEIYYESERQSYNTIAKVTQKGRSLYNVEYVGAAGRYIISFSNNHFSESEQIFTFGRQTVLGNAIRSKVYDTFVAWLQKEEIALKANSKSYLYNQELRAAVEIENWFNNLSSNGGQN